MSTMFTHGWDQNWNKDIAVHAVGQEERRESTVRYMSARVFLSGSLSV